MDRVKKQVATPSREGASASRPEQGEEDQVVPDKMGRTQSSEFVCTGCTEKPCRQRKCAGDADAGSGSKEALYKAGRIWTKSVDRAVVLGSGG